MTVVSIRVAASADDCFYRVTSEYWSLTTTYFYAGTYDASNVGYNSAGRVLNADIPAGATIDVAYVKLTCSAVYDPPGTDCRTKCSFELGQSPDTFSTQADYLGRTKTTAKVDWDFDMSAWSAESEYDTPSLVTPLQEVADLGALTHIGFFWDNDGSPTGEKNLARCYSWDGDTSKAPLFYAEYTAGGGAGAQWGGGVGGALIGKPKTL